MTNLDEDYAEAGFGADLGCGRSPAVLVVDAVRAYTEPDSPLHIGESVAVAGMCALLALGRKRGLPVVHTRVVYRPGGADGGVFRRKVPSLDLFVEGHDLARSAPGLEPAPGDTVIEKNYASAFFGTSLAAHLASRGIDTLLIGGFTTSGCIRATAVDACQSGIVPVVVADACGDRAPGPHDANLFDLRAKYADVVALERLPSYLDAS